MRETLMLSGRCRAAGDYPPGYNSDKMPRPINSEYPRLGLIIMCLLSLYFHAHANVEKSRKSRTTSPLKSPTYQYSRVGNVLTTREDIVRGFRGSSTIKTKKFPLNLLFG